MTIVVSARPGEDAERLLARGESLDQRLWHLPGPVAAASEVRSRLHAGGLSITSVQTDVAGLESALAAGSALRVRAVVVDAGPLGDEHPEAAADRIVRLLHGPLTAGAPLAIRNGMSDDAALGFVATEWVLSELPRLALWFDPAAAFARWRAGVGAELTGWMDAYGLRMGGMFVHGLGSDGTGGAHPADDAPDWADLFGGLPDAAPRVLAMDSSLDDDAVRDALRLVRSVR